MIFSIHQIFLWTLTAMGLIGAVLNVRGRSAGFLIWGITDVALALHNAWIGEISQATLWTMYTGLATYGYLSWRKKKTA